MSNENKSNQPLSDFVHVVLVEPQESLNIGAVARAMTNLGFCHLHVVTPRAWDRGRAEASACGAESFLDGIVFHNSIEDAVAQMQDVIAFSSRSRKTRQEPILLPTWATQYISNTPIKVALVFGPEDTGLTNEHLQYCGTIVRIPTSIENTSYNLSQAVLLALYELSRGNSKVTEQPRDIPAWAEQLQLAKVVDEIMWETDFYKEKTPLTVPALVRQLLFRLQPDTREMSVLLGMFSSIKLKLQRLK